MTEIKITRIQRDVKKKQVCLFKQTFWGGTGKSSCGTSSVEQCFGGLYSAPLRAAAGKRKSDNPCRWVIAFLVPCGTGRVNDKKVNEENSKVKTKAHTEPKLPLQREDVSKLRFCWIQHTTLEQKLQEVF
ncbi:hypothetical protein [Faecalibacterium prausnitzii]|uniref:hypothetical protein n=1 Tax=Faecalibacterium prausnitzii TaxID=853 RepID=UPI00290CC49D|nr:hypothetical protein [Faecalibacterium prausnitzii]MDU8724755.1 hypothetical protein [Faecalibacterium prausnitzii]